MNKRIIIVLLLLIMTVSLMVSALAEGGAGDGSGGGSNEPLALISSSVPDGSTGVALDINITMTYSKNVVNMVVRDNNLTCFALTDSKGTTVGINVLMGDDQVDPTIKNDIVIQPKARLSPDTSYTLTISGNLTSKSGVSLGQPVTLTFRTVSAPAASPSPVPAVVQSPEPIASSPVNTPVIASSASSSPAVSSAQTSASVPADTSAPEDTAGAPTQSAAASNTPASNAPASNAVTEPDNTGNAAADAVKQHISPIPYIFATASVIVIAGAIVIIVRKKK